jgi:hypothetical protein
MVSEVSVCGHLALSLWVCSKAEIMMRSIFWSKAAHLMMARKEEGWRRRKGGREEEEEEEREGERERERKSQHAFAFQGHALHNLLLPTRTNLLKFSPLPNSIIICRS